MTWLRAHRGRAAGALAVALVIAGVLIAVLGGSGHAPAGRGKVAQGAGRSEIAVAADYLGVSPAKLRASLRAGRSLAEVAASTSGKSVAGLTAKLVAARTAVRRTSSLPAKEQRLIRARIRRSVATSVRRHRVGGQAVVGLNIVLAARYLGIAPRSLRAELRRGRTLAQVADSSAGHSTAGLIATLLAARRKLLDEARAAGTTTVGDEQRALSKLRVRIAAAVNRPFAL